MQVNITPDEQENLILLTTGKGRTKWVLEQAGMSYTPLNRMRTLGQADEEQVNLIRDLLKRKDVKKLIAEQKRKKENSAAA